MPSSDPIYLPLAAAAKELHYGFSCETCQVTWRVDLDAMSSKLGPNFATNELTPMLTCPRCGSGADIRIVTLYRNASTSHTMIEKWK